MFTHELFKVLRVSIKDHQVVIVSSTTKTRQVGIQTKFLSFKAQCCFGLALHIASL